MQIDASPLFILILLCIVQLLIYYDRGLMASFVGILQGTLQPQPINDTAMGVLGSVFVFGYMTSCPIFAYLAKTRNIYRLMTVGLSMWCFAIIACACSTQYSQLLLARMTTGVAEASFASIAPTLIDDIASKKYRTSWLSCFYAMLPVGGSLGYVAGSVFASSSWRVGFLSQVLLMLPCVIILYYIKPTKSTPTDNTSMDDTALYQRATSMPTRIKQSPLSTDTLYQPVQMKHKIDISSIQSTEESGEHDTLQMSATSDDMLLPLQPVKQSTNKSVKWSLPTDTNSRVLHTNGPSLIRISSAPVRTIDYRENEFLTDVLILLNEPVYMLIVVGMSALTFVIGAMTFWAPIQFSKLLQMSTKRTSAIMGGITLVTGIAGTYLGGAILDYRGGGTGIEGVERALELISVSTAGAIMFAIISVSSDSAAFAFSALTMADLLMFFSSAPVNAALLSIVPKQLRALGMAISILLMHLLGDLPYVIYLRWWPLYHYNNNRIKFYIMYRSPLFVGWVSDQVNDVRLTMLIMCGWMSFSVIFWTVALILLKQRASKLRSYTKQLLTDSNSLTEDSVKTLPVITTQYQAITT